ncbi:hypothetical protein WISP_05350 [Willisornis vidua]|uniref:RIMS1 protein n=1 Tax=Willisornis vidua TaxID=1566151 RepID=A0ABQ9DUB7_9PASS|nr:hypothetical protein WISP_05350 [Willisornis vidua]
MVDDYFFLLELKMDDVEWLVTYCVGEICVGLTVSKFRKKAVLVSDQNGKGLKSERKRVPKSSLPKEGPTDDRERKERHEGRRLEKGKSQDYPDLPEKPEEGKVPDDEKQRKEDEYHTRYRSDPNLARYPVKPHPEEQQMRMHAKVSKARHERRHSDVALPHTEMEEAEVPENNLGKRSQLQGTQDRKSLVETQRSYSIDRTGDVRISVSKQLTNHSPPTPRHSPVPIEHVEYKNHESFIKQSRLDPSSAILMRKAKREKMETMLRNDSLSSDQSESVRPSPPKPHRAKRGGKKRQMSVSSSEEEGASTPEYTSCEDVEIESESVSEKGDLDYYWLDPATWHSRETSPISSHPVTWQPSKEGDRLIGRVILNKRTTMPKESGALLGLKVVGGKMTELGRLGAFITKVKKGSLADVVGHLRAGDEVLEWNGKPLPGATNEEVYNIILESKSEPQVEIIVSRPIGIEVNQVITSSRVEWKSKFVDGKVLIDICGLNRFDFAYAYICAVYVYVVKCPYPIVGSRPISDSDISDYDVDDGIGVVPPGSPEKWKDIAAKNKLGKALQLKRKEHINKEVPHSLLLQTHPSAVGGEDSYRKFQYLHATSIEVIGAVPAYLMVELDSLQLSLIMCRNWDVCSFSASLVVEERTRQMKMKVHRYNQTSGSGSSQEHEREQYTKKMLNAERVKKITQTDEGLGSSNENAPSHISRMLNKEPDSGVAWDKGQHPIPPSVLRKKQAFNRTEEVTAPDHDGSLDGRVSLLQHHVILAQGPHEFSATADSLYALAWYYHYMHMHWYKENIDFLVRKSNWTLSWSILQSERQQAEKLTDSTSHCPKYNIQTDQYRSCDNVSAKSSDSDVSDVSAISRTSSASRLSSTSFMSEQSERPRGRISTFTPKMQGRRMGTSGRITKSTSVSGEMYKLEHIDGSQSDTAVGMVGTGGKKRRSSFSAKVVAIVSRRSRSTSQLSQTEAGSKKLKSTIQRSTETGMAAEMRSRMVRQPSRESTDGSINSYSSEGNLIFPGVRLGADSQFSDFLDGLGPAQLVGRQTLATPAMGDIQIGMVDKKGQLEVEVIRARGLIQKPGSKSTPAPYVKVYLLENGACIAKKKTRIARKTLDPLYQQTLVFEESPQGKVLQVIVWGDYGRMDHKCFMGVAQILLEELDLSSVAMGKSRPGAVLLTRVILTVEVMNGTYSCPRVAKEPSASGAEEVSSQKTLGKGPSERMNSVLSLLIAIGTWQKYRFAIRVGF